MRAWLAECALYAGGIAMGVLAVYQGLCWLLALRSSTSDAVSLGVGSDQWKSIGENLREVNYVGGSDGETTS